MARKLRPYEALALYLCPDNPGEGKQRIDEAILASLRECDGHWNRHRAMLWFGHGFVVAGCMPLALRAYRWFLPALEAVPMLHLGAAVPVWIAAAAIIAGIGLAVMALMLDERAYVPHRPLPEPIQAWLAAQGKSDLRHWNELYWPYRKTVAHRVEIFGFVFWRRTPLPEDRYRAVFR